MFECCSVLSYSPSLLSVTNTPFFLGSRSIPNSLFIWFKLWFWTDALCLPTNHCHGVAVAKKDLSYSSYKESYQHQTVKYWKKIHIHCLLFEYSCSTSVWKGAGLSFDVLKYPELYQISEFPFSGTLLIQFCVLFEMALAGSCSTSAASSWEGISHELAEQDSCCELPVCPLAHACVVQVTCCRMSSVLPALFWIFGCGWGGGRSVGLVLEGRYSALPKGSFPSPGEMCWIMNALWPAVPFLVFGFYVFDFDECWWKFNVNDRASVVDVIFHKQHSKGAALPKFIQHIHSVFLAHTDFLQNRISNMQIHSFCNQFLLREIHAACYFMYFIQRNKTRPVGLGNRTLLAGFPEACALVVQQLSTSSVFV